MYRRRYDDSSDSDDERDYGEHHHGGNAGHIMHDPVEDMDNPTPALNLPDVMRRYNEDDNTGLAVFVSLISPLHTLKAVLQEFFYNTQRDAKESNMLQSAARKVAAIFVLYGLASEDECKNDSEDGLVTKITKALEENVDEAAKMMLDGNVHSNGRDFISSVIPANVPQLAKTAIMDKFTDVHWNIREKDIDPCNTSFIVQAMLINAIIQGSAVYAASYGWQQLFIATISDPIVIAVCHGLGATLVGLWLGSGRGISGIASAILVGATAFALQAYALPAIAQLRENIYPLSDVELQLVGGALTIMATMLWETLAMISSYNIDDELLDLDREELSLCFEYEFYIHQLILSSSLQVRDEDGRDERVG